MKFLLTGGTGLIGSALCRALCAQGHQVTVLTRNQPRAQAILGQDISLLTSLAQWTEDREFDGVINLAGEPIFDHAWSERQKQVLLASRVDLTHHLVEHIALQAVKPRYFLSGSAVGYYPDGNAPVGESHPPGTGFSSRLCVAWEQAALQAQSLSVPVTLLRTGLVLSATGGLLQRMVFPARLGLGAVVGNGQQWMSWIHLEDYVQALLWMLQRAPVSGPYDMTAPEPVTNWEFMDHLCAQVHRTCRFAIPAGLLRLGLGERASLLTEGQRVIPERLLAEGFSFAYATLPAALDHLLARS